MALMEPKTFILKLPHIESVNNIYEPNVKWLRGGKQVFTGMRLAPAASKMKNEIIHQIDALRLDTSKIDRNYPFCITLIFVMNRNIMKRDLDNLLKLTQDGIFTSLKFNDSRIFEIHAKKVLYKGAKSEYIKVTISQLEDKISDLIVE